MGDGSVEWRRVGKHRYVSVSVGVWKMGERGESGEGWGRG